MGEAEYIELIEKNPVAVAHLLVEKDQEIEKLRQHLVNAQKARFGTKSEKLLVDNQEKLFPLEELTEPAEQEPLPTIPVQSHTRAKRQRRELPKGTVVEVIQHPPVHTTCHCCGGQLEQLRVEVTKILNYVPASFKLEEHHRPVMVCNHCQGSSPKNTPLPAGIQLIPRSPAGVGLLSHIMISKFQDHIPLHRQEAMFARLGYDLPRARMSDWLGELAEALHPLHKAVKQQLLRESYLQGDETTVKIQDGEVKGKCHGGYFWGILAPPPVNLVYFHYAPSRAGEVPKSLLSGYQGVLQTDAYAGYNEVYVPDETLRAGCWAHVKRKFLEIEKLAGKDVQAAVKLIRKLYHVEPETSNLDEILNVRTTRSAPIIEQLHEYLLTWSQRTFPNSDVRKVLNYTLKQWDGLTLFLKNPHILLDNNLIENQMRPIALGRKNWLFAGSHEGAMRAAIFYTLLNSCRLNKVNSWQYFSDVLPRLVKASADEIPNLLPHRWKLTEVKNVP